MYVNLVKIIGFVKTVLINLVKQRLLHNNLKVSWVAPTASSEERVENTDFTQRPSDDGEGVSAPL